MPNNFKWETTATKDADITLSSSGSSSTLTIKSESVNKSAAFKFTYKADEARTVSGTLRVTTEYDVTKADVASLKSNFESQVVGLTNTSYTATATKPIEKWGQTDAAYTITGTSGSVSLALQKTIGSNYKVEWKVNTENAATVTADPNYSFTRYTISNDTAAVQRASFTFKIVNDRDATKTIQGTITVSVSMSPGDQDKQILESFKSAFANWPSNSNIATFWADRPISEWAQTNALYTARIKPNEYSSTYLSLPSGLTWSYSGAPVAGISTTSIGYNSISIDNSSLTGASGAASTITLGFSGASGTKTVSGTLVLTVIKQ